MAEIKISVLDQTRPPLALLYTDAKGRVISIHGPLLDQIKLDDLGDIVGEPLHSVLGIEYDASKYLVENVAQNGNVQDWALDIHPQRNSPISVLCTSVGTFNDRGDFIGADITLYKHAPSVATDPPSTIAHTDTLLTHIQQLQGGSDLPEDQALLQLYATVQFSALHVLLARMAGLRIAKTLETTINKLADQKNWPLRVSGDRLLPKLGEIPNETYRAMLEETVRFAANIIGRRMVVAEMRAVDGRMSERAVHLAEHVGLRHLFSAS
jgi:hypothetical protein